MGGPSLAFSPYGPKVVTKNGWVTITRGRGAFKISVSFYTPDASQTHTGKMKMIHNKTFYRVESKSWAS